MVYWMRSLVPTLKKSTSAAIWSAIRAALGTSIMAPISMRRLCSTPSLSSSSAHSSSKRRHVFTSSRVESMGNITLTSPAAPARRMARICVLNISVLARVSRTPRQPRKGFASGSARPSGSLSPPISTVRIITPSGAMPLATLL